MPSSRSKTRLKAKQPTANWSFEAIGTQWWVGIYEEISDANLVAIRQKVSDRIELFDATYSRFRSDSIVSKVAKTAGTYRFPNDSVELFSLYRLLYDMSDGVVTPLIGGVLSGAGYDADYSLQPKELIRPPNWDDVMTYEACVLTTKKPVLLDFGAAGKGYLVDIIGKLLKDSEIEAFCIDAGGDILCHDLATPLAIGLENPDDASQVVGLAHMTDGSLCGSAGNRRAWADFTHIIDPATLKSPRHIKAAWACAETALLADGLTTTLYFVPAAKLRKAFPFSYLIVYADTSVERSPDFPAELFTA
jgi:thiamine biosynthesis lipoprotein